jgi:hypothetical protein
VVVVAGKTIEKEAKKIKKRKNKAWTIKRLL